MLGRVTTFGLDEARLAKRLSNVERLDVCPRIRLVSELSVPTILRPYDSQDSLAVESRRTR
jgi:hypothetical protein